MRGHTDTCALRFLNAAIDGFHTNNLQDKHAESTTCISRQSRISPEFAVVRKRESCWPMTERSTRPSSWATHSAQECWPMTTWLAVWRGWWGSACRSRSLSSWTKKQSWSSKLPSRWLAGRLLCVLGFSLVLPWSQAKSWTGCQEQCFGGSEI